MGGKKALRRENDHLRAEAERQKLAAAISEAERNAVLDALAEVGFVRTTGTRRQADRVRAARAGVLVLADVLVGRETQFRVEREFIPTMFQGDVPGPLRASATLELHGDPAVLEALQQHLTNR